MADAHDAYAALRLPDYRRLLGGGVIASLGAEMLATAVGYEVLERTESALALGLVGLAQFLPVLLLALPAGYLADHFDRRYVLIGALTIMGSAATGLAVLSLTAGPIPIVYLCLVLIGVGRAFSAPARQSLVPQLVPLEMLPNAVAWNSTGWQLANMAGPALGGFMLWWFDYATAYIAAATAAAICIVLVGGIRPLKRATRRAATSLWDLLAGVQFVWRTKPILATMTLDLFAVLLGGATALLPIYARDILDVGKHGYGWLRAAPSIGAFVTALALAHRRPFEHPGRAMLGAVAGFGAAIIVFGLSESFWLSLVMLALTGALDNVSVVIRGTLVQTLTPDAMRGRVAAVNIIFISSSNELGAFESGVVARFFGPVVSVVSGGVGSILVVLTVLGLWPQMWWLGRLRPPLAEPVEISAADPPAPR
jgi:MFS family permease